MWKGGNPGASGSRVITTTTVERIVHEGRVDVVVSVEGLDEWGKIVLVDLDVLVFSLINGAFDPVGLVVVHGIADREATH